MPTATVRLPRHAREDGSDGSLKLIILLLFPISHVLDLLWKVAVMPLATLCSRLTSHIPGSVSDKNVVEQWGEVSLEWTHPVCPSGLSSRTLSNRLPTDSSYFATSR